MNRDLSTVLFFASFSVSSCVLTKSEADFFNAEILQVLFNL